MRSYGIKNSGLMSEYDLPRGFIKKVRGIKALLLFYEGKKIYMKVKNYIIAQK